MRYESQVGGATVHFDSTDAEFLETLEVQTHAVQRVLYTVRCGAWPRRMTLVLEHADVVQLATRSLVPAPGASVRLDYKDAKALEKGLELLDSRIAPPEAPQAEVPPTLHGAVTRLVTDAFPQ